MKPLINKMPKNNSDYVEIYAINLNQNPKLFIQQKKLIESQLKSSREIFKKKFGVGKAFKKNAREYLRRIRILP